MAEQCLVKLKSATGEVFEVDEAVASQSQFLKNVIEDVGVDSPIPLPNVSTQTLGQVLAYCKCYAAENDPRKRNVNLLEALEKDFRGWPGNAKLGKLVDMENLYDLIMATNYMHIESLLQMIYHTLAMMITKRTFGEIQQIFNSTNDLARGEQRVIGEEGQLLASLVDSLPMELQLEIKVKVGQRFDYRGEWSPWWYDVNARTLFVDLTNLDDVSNMHHQIAIILLHIDIGLVNTLVLQTCGMMYLSSNPSGGTCIEWVDKSKMELFKHLFDGIDMLKIENLIFDEEI